MPTAETVVRISKSVKLYIKKSHDKKYMAIFCIYKIIGIEVYC